MAKRIFESVQAMGEEVQRLGGAKMLGKHGHGAWSWGEIENSAAALEACSAGWTAQIEKAQSMIEQIQVELPLKAAQWEASVVGAYPSIPDFLMGVPECMRRKVNEQSDRAPIKVFVASSSSAAFSPEQLLKRGLACLALAIGLSNSRPVELWTFSELGQCASRRVEGDPTNGAVLYLTRIPTAPLDLSTACFALTQAGFMRGITYALGYELDGFNGRWAFDKQDLSVRGSDGRKKVDEAIDAGPLDLVVPPPHSNQDESIKDPIGWVRKNLELYGVEIDD